MTQKRNYPATRGGARTGPKSKYQGGSQKWSIYIPRDPEQAEECKRLIRLLLERYTSLQVDRAVISEKE